MPPRKSNQSTSEEQPAKRKSIHQTIQPEEDKPSPEELYKIELE